MAKNLHRVLTTYLTIPVTVDNPTTPKSGDPVRCGRNVGVAITDERFPYGTNFLYDGMRVNAPVDPINARDYANGETPVSFQLNHWRLPVFNDHATAAAKEGDVIYYFDTKRGPTGDVNYNLVINPGTGSNADGIAGVLRLGGGAPGIAANSAISNAIVELRPAIVNADMCLAANLPANS